MSATEVDVKLKAAPLRPMRASVRPSCQAKPEPNDVEPSTINSNLSTSVVRVRFGHWQPFPPALPMPVGGVPTAQGWKMQMFHLLDDMPGRQAGSTVALATLLDSGVPFQRVEIVAPAEAAKLEEMAEVPVCFDADFWMAYRAAGDMAEEGNAPMTITALEAALHLAKVQQRAVTATEDGVAQP